MDELLIVNFICTQDLTICIGSDYFTCDQAIRAEAINRLEVSALEVQIRFFDKLSFDLFRWKRREAVEDWLVTDLAPGRCGQARIQNLGWLRVADREFAIALNIATGRVRWRTNKAKVVLPTHRRNHVLRRKVESAIRVRSAYENQWSNGEKTIPNWRAGVDLDEMTAVGVIGHSGTSIF